MALAASTATGASQSIYMYLLVVSHAHRSMRVKLATCNLVHRTAWWVSTVLGQHVLIPVILALKSELDLLKNLSMAVKPAPSALRSGNATPKAAVLIAKCLGGVPGTSAPKAVAQVLASAQEVSPHLP